MRSTAVLVACLLLVGCQAGPPGIQPSPPTPPPGPPSRITLTATAGVGTAAGEVYIAARVLDVEGRGVISPTVTFSTNAGTVSPSAVVGDPGGQAQTTVRTTIQTVVRAAAGNASAELAVTPNPPIVDPKPLPPVLPPTLPPVPPPPPPPSPPTPPPPVPPPPPPPPAGAQVSMGCTKTTLTVSCNLAASYNNVPLQSTPPTFVSVDWDFGDGSSQIITGTPLMTHPYAQAGSYTVVAHATITTPDGQQPATASQSVTVP